MRLRVPWRRRRPSFLAEREAAVRAGKIAERVHGLELARVQLPRWRWWARRRNLAALEEYRLLAVAYTRGASDMRLMVRGAFDHRPGGLLVPLPERGRA